MKHFFYTKNNNTTSERFAHPVGIVQDKLLAIDLTEFDIDERDDYEAILNQIHSQYIQAIKDAGLGQQFRYFFFNGIDEIVSTK